MRISAVSTRKHHFALWSGMIALALVLGIAACGPGGKGPGGKGPGGKGFGGPDGMSGPDRPKFKIPVTCERIERGAMEAYLQTVGSIVPYKEVEIKSEFQGRIYYTKRWMEGDFVKEGEILARIDDRSLKIDIAEAESALDIAKEGILPASASLAQAIEDEEYNRQMLERGAISRNQYKQSTLTRIQQEERYKSAVAAVETRRAALTKLNQDIEKIIIKAPFEGMLLPLNTTQSDSSSQDSNLTLNEGLIVGSNQAICRLADIDQVVVELAVPGKDIDKVELGQKAVLDIYSKTGQEYSGKIYDISSTMDPTTRTFTVKVLVNNPKGPKRLRPGMFSKAKIITEIRPETIVVSRDLVLLRDNRHIVYVIEEVPDIASATKTEQIDMAIEEMDRDAIAADQKERGKESAQDKQENDNKDEAKGDPQEKPADPSSSSDSQGASTGSEQTEEAEESEPDTIPTKYVAVERELKLGLENREEYEIIEGLGEGDLLVTVGYETLTSGVDVRPTVDGKELQPSGEEKTPEDENENDRPQDAVTKQSDKSVKPQS